MAPSDTAVKRLEATTGENGVISEAKAGKVCSQRVRNQVRFLRHVVGDGTVTFRMFWNDKKFPGHQWFSLRDRDMIAWLSKFDEDIPGAKKPDGISFGPAPRARAGLDLAWQIPRVNCLWADIDPPDGAVDSTALSNCPKGARFPV